MEGSIALAKGTFSITNSWRKYQLITQGKYIKKCMIVSKIVLKLCFMAQDRPLRTDSGTIWPGFWAEASVAGQADWYPSELFESTEKQTF